MHTLATFLAGTTVAAKKLLHIVVNRIAPILSAVYLSGSTRRPPNKAMHRKLDPSLRLAAPSLSLASSSGDLRR